jgi:hypothetical protein
MEIENETEAFMGSPLGKHFTPHMGPPSMDVPPFPFRKKTPVCSLWMTRNDDAPVAPMIRKYDILAIVSL